MSALFLILAIVLFVLAGLGVAIGSVGPQALVIWGLASFALGHLFGGTLGDLTRRF